MPLCLRKGRTLSILCLVSLVERTRVILRSRYTRATKSWTRQGLSTSWSSIQALHIASLIDERQTLRRRQMMPGDAYSLLSQPTRRTSSAHTTAGRRQGSREGASPHGDPKGQYISNETKCESNEADSVLSS